MALTLQKLLGMPDGPHPWRDVAVAFGLKLALLAALYLLCFGPQHRPPADAAATADAVVGPRTAR